MVPIPAEPAAPDATLVDTKLLSVHHASLVQPTTRVQMFARALKPNMETLELLLASHAQQTVLLALITLECAQCVSTILRRMLPQAFAAVPGQRISLWLTDIAFQ